MKYPVQQGKGNFKKTVIESFGEMREEFNKIKADILAMKGDMEIRVEEEVVKNLDGKVEKIDAILTEVILQKEVLIDKGFMTREEMNKKHVELRDRRKK